MDEIVGNNHASIWKDKPELDGYLKRMLADGLSFSLIARRLSVLAEQPISRVAAIGRANRQGFHGASKPLHQLNNHPPKIKAVPVAILTRKLMQARAAADPPLPTSVAAFTKTVLDLERGDCRYPDPDYRDEFWFCDQPAIEGSAYCAEHDAICYIRKRL